MLCHHWLEVMRGRGTGVGSFQFILDSPSSMSSSSTNAIEGVSEFGIFSFVIMGIGLCLGLTYFIVNLVRRKM